MKNILVYSSYLAVVVMILVLTSGRELSVNSQNNSNENGSKLIEIVNDSDSGLDTTFKGNITSIITPWNTGNDQK